jgi:hypothetical protein
MPTIVHPPLRAGEILQKGCQECCLALGQFEMGFDPLRRRTLGQLANGRILLLAFKPGLPWWSVRRARCQREIGRYALSV